MKKIAIALQGTSETGKSELLCSLTNQIKNLSSAKVIFWKTIGEDISTIINVNGKNIGIETRGDPGTNLKGRLTNLVNGEHSSNGEDNPCDIIICATRTFGQTVTDFESACKGYDKICLRHQYVYGDTNQAKLQSKANEKTINFILQDIANLSNTVNIKPIVN